MSVKKIVKWIFFAGIFVIIAALIAAYVVVSQYDFNKFAPKIELMAEQATGRKLTLGGQITLKLGLTPALTVKDVRFANASWGSRQDLATIKRLELEVEVLPLLSGEVRVKRLIIIEPDILVETSSSGESNLKFEAPETQIAKSQAPDKAPAKPMDLSFDMFVMENAVLTYMDGKTKARYAVVLDRLDASSVGDGGLRYSLAGSYNRSPFEASGTLGPIKALTDPKTPWPLTVHARAGGTLFDIDGSIPDPALLSGVRINFEANGQSLDLLGKFAGASWPETGPFSVSYRFTGTGPQAFEFSDCSARLEGSDLAGSVSVDLSEKKPLINALISSKTLDLRPFIPDEPLSETSEKQKVKAKKGDRILPADPLPTEMFHLVNCKASVRVEKILLPQFPVTDFKLDLSLENGDLEISPLTARLEQGEIKADTRLFAKGRNLTAKTTLNVDQLDLGGMLHIFGVTNAFSGNADADVDLSAKGDSIRALMADLDGHVRMSVNQGRLKNKYLDMLGGDLASGILRMTNPMSKRPDFTMVNCMIAHFNIENGLADAAVLVLDTEYMSVIGEGSIDLKTEDLSMSLNPVPKQGLLSGLNLNLSLSLSELTQPFALGGTMAEPQLVVDRTKAAITLGKGVGGALLFGLPGIAAALISGDKIDKNPCAAAIAAAEKGVDYRPEKKKGLVGKTTDTVIDGAIVIGEGFGKGFKKLLGR